MTSPDPPEAGDQAVARRPRRRHHGRGSLGGALAADYPPVHCLRHERQKFGPGGNAIPDQLRGEPGHWTTLDVEDDLAAELGQRHFDLANPHDRRRLLPHPLEVGPADLVATIITFPQLRAEWPHLDLTDTLRLSWEMCYPTLADDVTLEHPSVGRKARA